MNFICINYVYPPHFSNSLHSFWGVLSPLIKKTILFRKLLPLLWLPQRPFENSYLLCDGHNGNQDKPIASVAATTKLGISQLILCWPQH
jgi:hypothetical protein